MSDAKTGTSRRAVLWRAAAALLAGAAMPRALAFQNAPHPDRKWYLEASSMKARAESRGDQSYGAVVVLGDALVGEGPSRVVTDNNPDAHAERVAILDAQRRLGRSSLAGSILYSTSRPCSLCEAAAAKAGIARMFYGAALQDAGAPRAP